MQPTMSKRFIFGFSCLQLIAMAALMTAVAASTNQEGLRFCCEKISSDTVCNDTCIQTLSALPTDTSTLTAIQTQALSSACSPSYTSFWTCIDETISPPLPEYYYCCARSQNHECIQYCQEILATADNWLQHFDNLSEICGSIFEEPFTCLLEIETETPTEVLDPNSIPEQPLYADWARVQCCYKAVADECRTSCLDLYSGQVFLSSFSTFQSDCIHRPSENELSTCILDVRSPCKLGCSGLQFCDSFNNRPSMSFRHCTATADRMAKRNYQAWVQTGVIPHPLITLFVNDVDRCLAKMWKMVSCISQVQPCHATTHITQICRNDCLKLLSTCSESEDTPQAVCNIIAPSGSEEHCISFESFFEPSEYSSKDIRRVTNPCTPNPCAEGYFCAINHRCQSDNQACTPYTCQAGCAVGDRPSFVVSEGGGVRVALVTDGERSCYGYFNCSENREDNLQAGLSLGGTGVTTAFVPVHTSCEVKKHCVVNNQTHEHQTTFKDGCNFCTCYYGRMTCTRRNCSPENEELKYASCACAMVHQPVCTQDGKTIPNSCIARCLGYSDGQYHQGDCSSLDPCGGSSVLTCGNGFKCLPNKHVCISPEPADEECSQYTCVSPEGCVSSEPVCADNNIQHTSLCSFLTTQGEIDYYGFCKPECSQDRVERVCGVNGETYNSPCTAENAYIAVDYNGPCRDVPGTNVHQTETLGNCKGVVCPQLPPGCVGVLSHDSCCPQCGSHMTLLLDKELLEKNMAALGMTYLPSTDMLRKLRYHISSLECELFGHVSHDDSLSVWVLPTRESSDKLMVEACNAEAVKLTTFINNHTPMLASDPVLSHLVAAEVVTTDFLSSSQTTPPSNRPSTNIVDPNSAGYIMPSVTLVTFLLILSFLF